MTNCRSAYLGSALVLSQFYIRSLIKESLFTFHLYYSVFVGGVYFHI